MNNENKNWLPSETPAQEAERLGDEAPAKKRAKRPRKSVARAKKNKRRATAKGKRR